MVVVRIIVKIVLLPVRICLTMIQLVVMFFTWLSATVFHILSGIICITAVLGYGFGQETGTEAVRMLVAGFILYILPVLSGWAVMWLETIKIRLMGDNSRQDMKCSCRQPCAEHKHQLYQRQAYPHWQ